MLARDALSRLAADVPKTRPHQLTQLARVLQRTLLACNAPQIPAVRALSRACPSTLHTHRSYATTARATKPTATVKKAVKAKAAAKTPAKRATNATLKKKVVPAKKTARKTAGKAAKRPVRKTVARKKKAAPKKAVARKPRKKVLSPEDKEKAVIRDLRRKALREPVSYSSLSGINTYVAAMCTGPNKGTTKASQIVTDATKNYKTLTPAEHEHYNHLANEQTAVRRAEYDAWIHSHTPDEIRIANNARALLRKKLGRSAKTNAWPAHTTKLQDDRQVKKAVSAYVLFAKERWASGDYKGIKVGDSGKLAGNEWKALSASEKKKYQDEAQADQARAAREKAALAS